MNGDPERPRRPRPSATLSRYVVSEMMLPSLIATAAFGLVFLMTDLLGYADLIVNRGLETRDVAWIAVLQLLPTLSRTLPFAVLIGTLVGLGRLSADRELLALEASGLSPRQLARPGLYFALAATVVSLAMSVGIAPAAQQAVRERMIQLSDEKPGLALKPGLASQVGDWRIEAGAVEDDGARLANVLLYMPSLGETVFSKTGAIQNDALDGAKQIVLEDGLMLSNGETRSSLLRFERMETRLPELRSDEGVPVDLYGAMSMQELVRSARDGSVPLVARFMKIELHRRFALGAATLPFGLLAIGLALARSKLSRSSGTVLGIVGAIGYYALVQLSEGIMRDDQSSVPLLSWMPNLVLTGVALLLIVRAGRRASRSDRGTGRGGAQLLARTGLVRAGLRMKRWALPRYVSAQFGRMVAVCLFGLVLAYLIIDVFDNLKWFNTYGATAAEISRFYAARLPVLAARIVPMALLIAVALTISLIGANGELLGMRACGIPVFRVLAPVWLLCGLAVPADHLLANEIVPRASERASFLKRTEIKNQEAGPSQSRERVWYRVGSRIHEMELLDLLSGKASAVTLYDLGDDGLPERRTDAEGALNVGGGLWLLSEPRSVELAGSLLARDPEPDRLVEFGEEAPSEVETAHLTPSDLRATIADPALEKALEPAYRTDLQMKLAAPLACLLLPLIALFFAATGPPFPRPVHTLVASAIIAVTHALVTGIAGSMGHGGTLSPWLAGWMPSLLFGGVALLMGIRLRRRLSRAG